MKFYYYKTLFAFSLLLFLTTFSLAQTEREKGIEFYEKGDYAAAVVFLEKVVEVNKNDYEALRFLGMSFAQLKKTGKAREIFKKVSKIVQSEDDKTFDQPVKITSRSFPRYTEEARRNNISGIVILVVEFKRDGKLGNIFPLVELPDGLTESAVRAMRGVKFKPAIKDGKPVSVIRLSLIHI